MDIASDSVHLDLQMKTPCVLVGEYMALPASQYSVLDGAKVERLTDDTFRVNVSGFSFFSFEIEPILTVCVQPTDAGCRIELLACKLAGSPVVEAQNNKFSARMVNNGVHHISHCCNKS